MNQRPPRILLVDDEEINLDFYERILVAAHYAVAKARDGVEGLDKFEKFGPDLVLVDMVMPRLNGIEFCSRLKRNARGRTVPVLMLTGMHEEDTEAIARKNGATDFLNKPVEARVLLDHIQALLQKPAA
jgi:DNA-binding response OmpR family regulator